MPHLTHRCLMELCFVFCFATTPNPNERNPKHKQPFMRTNSLNQCSSYCLNSLRLKTINGGAEGNFLMYPELPLISRGVLDHSRIKKLSLESVFPIINSKQHFVHGISRYEKHDCTVCIFTGNGCKIEPNNHSSYI